MKKALSVLMALALAAAVAGCGAQSAADGAGSADAASAAADSAPSAAASVPAESADAAPAQDSAADVPDVPMGDRMNDDFILTYADKPWYGAWKDAETGYLMVWEAQEGIGSSSGEEQPDGSIRITAEMIDGGKAAYRLSADGNVLQALGGDGTAVSTWVTPALEDAPTPLPAEVWDAYGVELDGDPLTDSAFLMIDAFRIGDCLYSGLVGPNEYNTYTVDLSGLFEDWTQEIAFGEVDGSYQFELYDGGLPDRIYTKLEG